MRKELKEQLLNMDVSNKMRLVDEINSCNGMLDFLVVWNNDEEFFETFFVDHFDAVRAVYFGSYHISDPYVRFSWCGKLESLTEDDFECDFRNHIDEVIESLEEVKIDLDDFIEGWKENEKD